MLTIAIHVVVIVIVFFLKQQHHYYHHCWNYKVMGSQRSYLKDLIDDRDDADDEYWLIRDAVDCMRTSSSQCVQSLVSTSRLILTTTTCCCYCVFCSCFCSCCCCYRCRHHHHHCYYYRRCRRHVRARPPFLVLAAAVLGWGACARDFGPSRWVCWWVLVL